MPSSTASFPYINSIDLHWTRLDGNKQHRSRDGISSRILKVLFDPKVKSDIVINTLDTLSEFYRQNTTTKIELVEDGLFTALMAQFQSSIDAKSLKTASRVLKCCLELCKIDEDASTPRQALLGLVNAGLIDSIIQAYRACSNDASVLKYIGYVLRYLSEMGIVVDSGYGHDSKFLEDVSIYLLKREASVTTIFNYSRNIVLMRDSKMKMREFVCSAVYTTFNVITSCDRSRQSVESYRILCTLLVFHTWECIDHPEQLRAASQNHLTADQYINMFDMIVVCWAKIKRNPSMVALMCIAVRTSLRPFVGKDFKGSFPSTLQRHLLDHTVLTDLLLSTISLHCDNYRVLVSALECLFCLTSPHRSASDESSYHIITASTLHPPEVCRLGGRYTFPPAADERCIAVLDAWWPYAVRARLNARWRRRKSFCMLLACCIDMSCAHKDSAFSNGQMFPPLALIYSAICPLDREMRAMDKVFFSKTLCSRVASFI
jgi:hypothetical protein